MASPRTLTRIALAAALMTALTALVPSTATAAVVTPRTKMYRVTNDTRTNHAIRRVEIHDRLSQLAKQHSIKMANTGANGTLFHVSNPAAYYLKGIRWSTWGENVGVTGGTVWDVQKAFMGSPGHRANILNTRFRRVAIGAYRDSGGLLWVTVFFYAP